MCNKTKAIRSKLYEALANIANRSRILFYRARYISSLVRFAASPHDSATIVRESSVSPLLLSFIRTRNYILSLSLSFGSKLIFTAWYFISRIFTRDGKKKKIYTGYYYEIEIEILRYYNNGIVQKDWFLLPDSFGFFWRIEIFAKDVRTNEYSRVVREEEKRFRT